MKVIIRHPILTQITMCVVVACCLFVTSRVQSAHAIPSEQTPPEPELVATWQGIGERGFDLYKPDGTLTSFLPANIVWWDTAQYTGSCPISGVEFADDGATIQFKGWWPTASPQLIEEQNCDALASSEYANVIRRGPLLYYFVDGQLSRKSINVGPENAATALSNAPELTKNPGEVVPTNALVTLDSLENLVWADFIDETQLTIGDEKSVFYRMKADDSAAATILFEHDSYAPVIKLEAMQYTLGIKRQALAWLTSSGDLYRYHPTSSGPGIIKLGSKIRDFAVHTYEDENGKRISTIVAVTGIGINSAPNYLTPESKVLTIDPITGTQTDLGFTIEPNFNNQLYSVAVDSGNVEQLSVNVYISENAYDCSNGCSTTGTRIFRRRLFAKALNQSCIDKFCLLLDKGDGGRQLASDDRWLYFGRNENLYRYPTDAPPIEIDIAATRLEINQAIQNLNHDFPLVAGHSTIVRGYATVLQDSTQANGFQLTARLSGKLNGQPLPGSPLTPVDSVVVDDTSDLATQRADKEKTFLFELPKQWVQNQVGGVAGATTPSSLELTLIVNPNQAVTEINTANNQVSEAIDVYQRETTCLVTVPMLTEAPEPDALPPGLAFKLDYAQKFIPISNFKVWQFHKTYFKEGVDYFGLYDTDFSILSNDGKPFILVKEVEKEDGTKEKVSVSGGGLQALKILSYLSNWPCPYNTYWVGVVHPETEWTIGGVASGKNPVYMQKLADDRGGTLAHELVHTFGRQHTDCDVNKEDQQNYDDVGKGLGYKWGLPNFDPCTLGPTDVSDPATYVGFDSLAYDEVTDSYGMAVRLPEEYADFMSYAKNKWPSMLGWYWLFTREHLYPTGNATRAFVNAAGDPVVDDVLLVQGTIAVAGGAGTLDYTQRLPIDAAPAERITESAVEVTRHSNSPYEIRLIDADGVTLASTVAITTETHSHTAYVNPWTYVQYVPLPRPPRPETARVQLVENGTVLDERVASANPPTVSITEFTTDANQEIVNVAWNASDADGDNLEAVLFFSADDGATWRVITQGIRSTQANVPMQNLAASDSARLRVMVSDGFHSAMATSEPFSVAEHPPTPVIDGLREGEQIVFGTTQAAYGIAYDADEGSLADDALTWSLRGPTTSLAKGRRFLLRDLAPGAYTLTLLATDSTGLNDQTSVNFDVLPLAVSDGDVPLFDGLCTDSSYANAVHIRLPRGSRTVDESRWPEVRMLHAAGALYVCFTDQANGRSTIDRLVGLQIDTDNSGGTKAQSGDIGFFIDENGIATQTSAFFDSIAPTSLPSADWDALVYPSEIGWSAEFRIDDTLIGGWEHAARLLIKHEVNELFDDELNWPSTGVHSQPGTWATAYFGTPPAPANLPPVANAGSNTQTSPTESMTIYLDGGSSYDLDDDRLRYQWRQVDGPSVRLTNASQRVASFTANPVNAPTDLRFALIVNDGEVDSVPDEVIWRLLPSESTIIVDPSNVVYLPLIKK